MILHVKQPGLIVTIQAVRAYNEPNKKNWSVWRNQVSQGRRSTQMLIPTIIMGVAAIVLLYIGYQKGGGEHLIGLRSAWNLLLQIIPLLILAFIAAGMVQVLVPVQLISRWIGAESGWRGILMGTLMGAIAPGGP
jgi:hypothetical protein